MKGAGASVSPSQHSQWHYGNTCHIILKHILFAAPENATCLPQHCAGRMPSGRHTCPTWKHECECKCHNLVLQQLEERPGGPMDGAPEWDSGDLHSVPGSDVLCSAGQVTSRLCFLFSPTPSPSCLFRLLRSLGHGLSLCLYST